MRFNPSKRAELVRLYGEKAVAEIEKKGVDAIIASAHQESKDEKPNEQKDR